MRWTRQYRDSETDYVPEMERLVAFLPETVPQQSRTAIVHGDYRIDNVLFDGDGTLTAVLDWELATLGEIVQRYSERSGVPVATTLDWYFAYNLFRLAGIVQGIKKRVIDGTASNSEAAEMAKRVPMLAQAAWRFAERAGA
jgi:aminoglycoside phosphotransferase (APT) family kinase protein